jgi:hypothetical protein
MTATQVTNATPAYDPTDNPTNCCPRFKPEPWDGQELHFENKPFVSASTVSLFHMPLNMRTRPGTQSTCLPCRGQSQEAIWSA